MSVREAKVRTLMAAAQDGMKVALEIDDNDYTAAEVFSAYLTLAAVALEAALSMGADRHTARAAVERLLRLVPADERIH